MPGTVEGWHKHFLQSHGLGRSYLPGAKKWFDPLAEHLADFYARTNTPILVALNGSQGSGKSTLGDYLVTALGSDHKLSAVALSLDDFYYTHAERLRLSQTIHPLLKTRGVPGTHDMALLTATLDALLANRNNSVARVPRFDKSRDDRRSGKDWDVLAAPVDIVILEGWCLGALPQAEPELLEPVNKLESLEDQQGLWRTHINHVVGEQFVPLYGRVDQWVMLQAPSFDCVYQWRCEQEHKLAASLPPGSGSRIMSDDDIARFIQHYQRITEQCLVELPARVNHLYQLDRNRSIVDYRYRIESGVG